MTSKMFLSLFCVILFVVPMTATAQMDEVEIPDPNLRAAIEDALGLAAGAAITADDLAGLTSLSAANDNIEDLTGLEYATNLTRLDLGREREEASGGLFFNSNNITDLTPLRGLRNLIVLILDYNNITDLTPLGGLTNLSSLHLTNNNITDLTPLGGLTNLTSLAVSGNPIADVPPISGLTELRHLWVQEIPISNISFVENLTNLELLYLRNNTISDISPLTQLTKLKRLELNCNRIVDIAPLVANRRFGAEAHVNLIENPLNSESVDVHIPALKERGVTVVFGERNPNDVNCDGKVTRLDVEIVSYHLGATAEGIETYDVNGDGAVNIFDIVSVESAIENAEGIRTPKTLEIVSGSNQEGLPSSALENPFVVEVRDQSDKPLPEIEVTFSVTGGGGTLSETSTTTDSNGRAESTLTLGPNPGTNTVTVYVTGIEEGQLFTAEGIRPPNTLEIVSGDGQEGWPGFWLAEPFVVEVRDDADRPFSDIEVRFTVSSGGGTLSSTSDTTDSNGRAESFFFLGQNPGTNTVTVSVAGVQEELTFTAVGSRMPTAFVIISGLDQTGLINEALPHPIVVEVRDQSGEPMPDVEVAFSVSGGGGTLSVTSATTDSSGRAESTLALGPDPGTNTVEVAVTGIQQKQTVSAIAELPRIPGDVNADNVVDIFDLVSVTLVLGAEGADLAADVNGDGVVDIFDLVLVAGAMGDIAAAPSFHPPLTPLTATDVGEWLAEAQGLDLTDAPSQRGVLFLEQLLAALIPKDTALLPNYPNPFNPETWLPYQLAETVDVHISIYNTAGALIRRLDMGHQSAGFYTEKGQAAYWDGRNEQGGTVASGVYFYQLRAGNYSQMRRMLVVK